MYAYEKRASTEVIELSRMPQNSKVFDIERVQNIPQCKHIPTSALIERTKTPTAATQRSGSFDYTIICCFNVVVSLPVNLPPNRIQTVPQNMTFCLRDIFFARAIKLPSVTHAARWVKLRGKFGQNLKVIFLSINTEDKVVKNLK